MIHRKLIQVPAALCVLLSCGWAAQAQSHPAEPAVNLGDTSFLDAIGGPGLLVEAIGDGSRAGKIADAQGRATSLTPDISTVSELTHIAYLAKRRIFKAWYGVEVIGVVAHVNAGAQGSSGGFGDLTVSPLILQWAERKVRHLRIQQRVVLDFDLPTGEYRRDSMVNLSGHAFTVHPYYAITAYPAKRLETSWRVHYLWNSRNDAPPFATGVRSTQAGQAIHFNATLGYKLGDGLWIGPNGYYLKQITSPQIGGRSLENSPEQVGAIGAGCVWDMKRVLLYANFYHELGAENRPEGNKLVLRVQWTVGK